MQSMTGYGKASGVLGETDFDVQIKTVNGRFLDIRARVPHRLLAMESALQKTIRKRLLRGRVDVWIDLREVARTEVNINPTKVKSYLEVVRQLGELGITGDLDVSTLLTLPSIMEERENTKSSDDAQLKTAILECSERALTELMEHRTIEGTALKNDLAARLFSLRSNVHEIADLSGELVASQQKKLEKRLAGLKIHPQIDTSRIAQEVVFYAERSDISEELTRLKFHISRFQEILNSDEKAVGKNLDFLTQELLREMNTILSKSSKTETSNIAVDSKVTIEKIREQVQNVE
jgi:uncharacterized protein (TIGR00255 family)